MQELRAARSFGEGRAGCGERQGKDQRSGHFPSEAERNAGVNRGVEEEAEEAIAKGSREVQDRETDKDNTG